MYFSRATPNLATVIPAMDHIDQQLTAFSRDKKYTISIRTAVTVAKKTLNRYYSLTDSSEVYRIMMGKLVSLYIYQWLTSLHTVLHPRHKLAYFKNVGWQTDWIEMAEALVCEEFNHSYSSIQTSMQSTEKSPDVNKVCTTGLLLFRISCCEDSLSIFLIIYLHSHHQSHKKSGRNWIATSSQMLNTSTTLSNGGMTTMTHIQPYPGWLLITFQSQVCAMFRPYELSNEHYHSHINQCRTSFQLRSITPVTRSFLFVFSIDPRTPMPWLLELPWLHRRGKCFEGQ